MQTTSWNCNLNTQLATMVVPSNRHGVLPGEIPCKKCKFFVFPTCLAPSANFPCLARLFLPQWLVRLWATCDCSTRLATALVRSALNHQVVISRPDRQGVGRDPSTNWTSVRIILSVPLISFIPFSQLCTVSHELDASSSRNYVVRKISITLHPAVTPSERRVLSILLALAARK